DAKRRTDVGRRLHGCERVLVDGEVVEPALLVEADRGLELRQKLHEHAGIARDPQRLQRIAAEQQLRELAHSVRSETAADPLPGDEREIVAARSRALLPSRRRELDSRRRRAAHVALARKQADADEPVGDDEVLDAAVRFEHRSEAVGIDAGDEEVRVLRVLSEQLVADRAADEVRIEPEAPHPVFDNLAQRCATASISISAPAGSFATSNVERAGGFAPTCFAYTEFIAWKSSRFWRNTVVLT